MTITPITERLLTLTPIADRLLMELLLFNLFYSNTQLPLAGLSVALTDSITTVTGTYIVICDKLCVEYVQMFIDVPQPVVIL